MVVRALPTSQLLLCASADAVPDGNLLGERPGFSEAVAETAKARANALASCGDTWFMRGNDDELVQVFPFYFVSAEQTEWHS